MKSETKYKIGLVLLGVTFVLHVLLSAVVVGDSWALGPAWTFHALHWSFIGVLTVIGSVICWRNRWY
jgi:predicted glycosyl hydrolase (DUF1957 family)